MSLPLPRVHDPKTSRFDRRRDRIGAALANLALRVASRNYRQMVAGSIEYGLRAAKRDVNEGRSMPPTWRA